MASQRSVRLSKISNDSGVFVYDGSAVATEHVPTALRIGKNEPVLDEDGLPVVDAAGEQVFQKTGGFKRGPDGNPILGGVPKEVKVRLDTKKVQGVEFPKGKKVLVENPKLAQKLRCLVGFSEVLESTEEEPEVRRGRGRPAKSDESKAE